LSLGLADLKANDRVIVGEGKDAGAARMAYEEMEVDRPEEVKVVPELLGLKDGDAVEAAADVSGQWWTRAAWEG
jgi:hypothetical protein